MYEYKTFIIEPDPEYADKQLNALAAEGWRVVSAAPGDRVLMERVIHIHKRGILR